MNLGDAPGIGLGIRVTGLALVRDADRHQFDGAGRVGLLVQQSEVPGCEGRSTSATLGVSPCRIPTEEPSIPNSSMTSTA